MITLLGSLLGFGTSFLPEVLNYFKRGQEQKHELQRMKMEIELIQDGLSLAMEKAAAFNLSRMNFLILAQVILLRKT